MIDWNRLFNFDGFGTGILIELIGTGIEVFLIIKLLTFFERKREDRKYRPLRIGLLERCWNLLRDFKVIYNKYLNDLTARAQAVGLRDDSVLDNNVRHVLFDDRYLNYYVRQLQELRDIYKNELANSIIFLDEKTLVYCAEAQDVISKHSQLIYDNIFFARESRAVTLCEIKLEGDRTLNELDKHIGLLHTRHTNLLPPNSDVVQFVKRFLDKRE